jgi:hypothetical protein
MACNVSIQLWPSPAFPDLESAIVFPFQQARLPAQKRRSLLNPPCRLGYNIQNDAGTPFSRISAFLAHGTLFAIDTQ